MASPPRVAVLGAGNMGAALLGGMLKAEVAEAAHCVATTRTEASAAAIAFRFHSSCSAGGVAMPSMCSASTW